MAKVNGAYDSLVRGVSQQVREKRLSGQHEAQDNMISDPVEGLRRRPGSIQLLEANLAGTIADLDDFSTNFVGRDLQLDDREITLATRRPRTSGPSLPLVAFRRGADGIGGDGAAFAPSYTAAAQALLDDGINSVVAVGRYVVIAHNKTVGSTTTDLYGSDLNRRRSVVSIKNVTYSREYRIRVKAVGFAEVTVMYATPNIYAPGGGVDPAAAEAAQPFRVAQQLGNLLAANSAFTARFVVGVQDGSVLIIANSGVTIEYLTATDGGDGSGIAAVWQEVENPALLPAAGIIGHVIKVVPAAGESYYLRAQADQANNGRVVWRESTSAAITPVSPFCIGVILGNTFYVGANPADLQAALPGGMGDPVVPTLASRVAGDDESAPAPHFIGRVITCLALFQDRLLCCSGPVVTASQISGYFNFFRSTVLTYPDDDAVEVYATGAEDDVIRSAVIFDRSLVLFGDKFQYATSGKIPLTGATATLMQSSAHKDAARVPPLALGDLLFFVKSTVGVTTAYQINVGQVEDTSNAFEISQQLSNYLDGEVREVVGIDTSSTIVVRTTEPRKLYVFKFLDTLGGERLLDSWSRWTFHEGCGEVVAISTWKDSLRVLFASESSLPAEPPAVRLVWSRIDIENPDTTRPHLDSSQDYLPGEPINLNGQSAVYTGAAAPSRRWHGRDDGRADLLWEEFGEDPNTVLGYQFPSAVTLTSPYMRDRQDRPILAGDLTVSYLNVGVSDAGACKIDVSSPYGSFTAEEWHGRVLMSPSITTPEISLQTTSILAPVELETRDYAATISAVKWLPLTVTSVEWVGQYFNRIRRV